jgi:hypothetical protein
VKQEAGRIPVSLFPVENRVMGDDADDPIRQFAAAWVAAAGVLREWAQRLAADTSGALERLAHDPAIRAVIETGRSALGGGRPCECACAMAHPHDVGVCDNRAVTTRRLATDVLGEVDVPLCAPCAVAQGLSELAW